MEVTVVDTGDLPADSIISFHTGSVRRSAQIDKNKAISLPCASGSEPVRVDLMSQVGSYTFDMVEGQEVYEVPIGGGDQPGGDVKLKVQIRPSKADGGQATDDGALQSSEEGQSGSTVKKLQTALTMRSYLDNHDVLRQMQELLQEMVTHRPDDPIEYMIQRLEQVCLDSQGVELDLLDAAAPAAPAAADADKGKAKTGDVGDSEEEEDDDDAPDLPLPPPPQVGRKRQSVSEEAYGSYNQRKAYEAKVIAKDEGQKGRIREVMKQCWMFQSHTPENVNAIIDAMDEKRVSKGEKLINQGDYGEVMWIIESGALECFKTLDGQEKLVKTCQRGDVFGELALLYGCPRAASVVSSEECVLWELDRETFKAICFEAAQAAPLPQYEGFVAPGAAGEAGAEAPGGEEAMADVTSGGAKADEAEDDDGSEGGDPPPTMASPRPTAGKRREGVSAEAMQEDMSSWVPPKFEKSAEERAQLSDIIRTSQDSKLHMLFGVVQKDTFEKIIDAMQLMQIAEGQDVIEQGDVGDYFYIVKSGDFDIFVKKTDQDRKKVFEAGVGFAFGELALLYNAPRSATICAARPAEVWALDRTAFRNLVIRSAEARFKQHVEFLRGVEIFQVLNDSERASLAEVLEEEEFEDDEAIVEQDEKDDKMFIVLSGSAVACIKGEQGEVEVMSYSVGSYFGEIALLSGEPRKASVYAVGHSTCLYITRATFLRVLGSLSQLLERNIGKYEKYQDAIANASEHGDASEEAASPGNKDDASKQPKSVRRKRERKAEVKLELAMKSDSIEGAGDAPPETLADKVKEDFKNPALVTPSDEWACPDNTITMFGGMVMGQKFTNDKILHCRSSGLKPSRKDEEDVYSWNNPSKLKKSTAMSVVCQKGQKSPSDPTPNQDNFFIHQGSDGISFYGVADGHGPFGHLVSFRLVQTLPALLKKSPHYGKDWPTALKEAFLEAQKDLCEFCATHQINIEASGAAGSILVQEEQTVHIAFIGDSRIMLGSWDRRNSRLIFCTKDHKPELPEERKRLEEAGSEVREIDAGSFRIYLPGSNFPGLTMSRAFGDTACGGVLREPEYHKYIMQPTDQWYAIVASDGIWEFMEGEEVCNLTAKKLRLKGPMETLRFLTNASRKRWAYCCGDYCDDITAILVQWNAQPETEEDSKNNHSLVVKKQD